MCYEVYGKIVKLVKDKQHLLVFKRDKSSQTGQYYSI